MLITTYDANGRAKGEGTGFVISTDINGVGLGRVVTNAHIIKDASVIRLTNLTGHDYVFHGIMGYDEQVDLAILFVQSPEHQSLAFLRLSDSKSIQEGQHILVIGNPEGLYGSISDSIISSIRHYPKNWLQITAPISPGSSGSPVMNDLGEVVGVVKAFWIEGQNLNFAISTEAIRAAVLSETSKGHSSHTAGAAEPTVALKPFTRRINASEGVSLNLYD